MHSAPAMIAGLFIGLYFTFYGYTAQRLLTLLSSLFTGALIALLASLLALEGQVLIDLLVHGYRGSDLLALVCGDLGSLRLFITVVSSASGALLFFFAARNTQRFARVLLSLFSPLATALLVLFILRLFVSLPISVVFATLFWILILAATLFAYERYVAAESALIAAMLLALLITRFWHLGSWVFYALWAILAVLGILNQRTMLKAKSVKEAGDG